MHMHLFQGTSILTWYTKKNSVKDICGEVWRVLSQSPSECPWLYIHWLLQTKEFVRIFICTLNNHLDIHMHPLIKNTS